jgi:hypothetical protein
MVADAERYRIGGKRRSCGGDADRGAEQCRRNATKARMNARFKFDYTHVLDLSISFAVLLDASGNAQSLKATALQSMKWLTEYSAERVMNISAWK